mmetsp:Transcript_49507/g.159894  ORF Transcript_49507/g.159894 Transcript_49507/m.159894 type:complete len:248 (+) Transcript_49507:3802-4545(+)
MRSDRWLAESLLKKWSRNTSAISRANSKRGSMYASKSAFATAMLATETAKATFFEAATMKAAPSCVKNEILHISPFSLVRNDECNVQPSAFAQEPSAFGSACNAARREPPASRASGPNFSSAPPNLRRPTTSHNMAPLSPPKRTSVWPRGRDSHSAIFCTKQRSAAIRFAGCESTMQSCKPDGSCTIRDTRFTSLHPLKSRFTCRMACAFDVATNADLTHCSTWFSLRCVLALPAVSAKKKSRKSTT